MMICLSFDIEERFHSQLSAAGAPRDWQAGRRIELIIDHLQAENKKATFFVVGELAKHDPRLIRRIADCGFEVASHSYRHLMVSRDDLAACRRDIADSKKLIEDITGIPVYGYRAPSWSAQLADEWLWETLLALGFRYDASLFPFKTTLYGSFANPLTPFWLLPGLMELPPSVGTVAGLRFPYAGGFYFRLYPVWLTRWFAKRDVARGQTPVMYFHPWEFGRSGQMPEKGWFNRFVAGCNIAKNWQKFAAFLAGHSTMTLWELCQSLGDMPEKAVAEGPGKT